MLDTGLTAGIQQFFMETEKTYKPISCSFYDELEALATLKRECVIEYLSNEGVTKSVSGRIVDFFIEDKVEFLLLQNNQKIRLDFLKTVDGKVLKNYC